MKDQELINALFKAHQLISGLATAMHDMLGREKAREERIAALEAQLAIRKAKA